jgi:hypothetical protein
MQVFNLAEEGLSNYARLAGDSLLVPAGSVFNLPTSLAKIIFLFFSIPLIDKIH